MIAAQVRGQETSRNQSGRGHWVLAQKLLTGMSRGCDLQVLEPFEQPPPSDCLAAHFISRSWGSRRDGSNKTSPRERGKRQ
jgi:hypothetical protein